MKRTVRVVGVLLTAVAMTGCVERRFVIESTPPGAQVLRDGRPIGFTPCDDFFVYYGTYHFTLVKDGYETLNVFPEIKAPWYEYPPLDFIVENLLPFKIRDVRRLHFQMEPKQAVRTDEVLDRATGLREQGKTIGEPKAPPPGRVAPPAVMPPADDPAPPPR
jgi:hypothetical protein